MNTSEKDLLLALADAMIECADAVCDSPFTPMKAKQTAANMKAKIEAAKERLK